MADKSIEEYHQNNR